MKAYLSLEAIGHDTDQTLRLWEKVINDSLPEVGTALCGGMPRRHWVAEITGTDPRYHYRREFIQGRYDYRDSNSTGSRGVRCCYTLESGHLYEVKEPVSWSKSERYFCAVTEDGIVTKITQEEADEWLKRNG